MKIINTILALSAISLTFVSCSSDNDEAVIPQEDEKVHVSFDVICKTPETTRADMNLTGNGYASMVWRQGDQIGVSADKKWHCDNIEVKVDAESTNTERATAEGNVDYTDEGYLCIYPAGAFAQKIDKNSAVIVIPDIQTIETGFQISQSAFLQVGYTKKTSNFITMETPCSFLVFNTGNNNNIKSVTVRAFDGDDNEYSIAGAISVNKTETSGFSQASGNAIGNHYVTNEIQCNYQYGNCFPERHNFAIAIRPGKPHKLVVEVTLSDNTIKTYTTTKMDDGNQLEFVRAYYHQFPTF